MDLAVIDSHGKHLGRRYKTVRRAFELLAGAAGSTIVEFGTTRSFVSKGHPGVCNPDPVHWNPSSPESWDWGAGCFTRVCAEAMNQPSYHMHTVDPLDEAITISKVVTEPFRDRVTHHETYSGEFLSSFDGRIDLLYMDHCETDAFGAKVHLDDTRFLLESDVLAERCVILVDDVEHDRSMGLVDALKWRWTIGKNKDLGKGTFSIPLFLENGFRLEQTGYQYLLVRGF